MKWLLSWQLWCSLYISYKPSYPFTVFHQMKEKVNTAWKVAMVFGHKKEEKRGNEKSGFAKLLKIIYINMHILINLFKTMHFIVCGQLYSCKLERFKAPSSLNCTLLPCVSFLLIYFGDRTNLNCACCAKVVLVILNKFMWLWTNIYFLLT